MSDKILNGRIDKLALRITDLEQLVEKLRANRDMLDMMEEEEIDQLREVVQSIHIELADMKHTDKWPNPVVFGQHWATRENENAEDKPGS